MSPVAPDCVPGGGPDVPHAATGWCLAATGAPVLVITTLPTPPGDPAVDITVTLVDPSTGALVAPQAVVACGDKDWEVNQLCDFTPGTDELIETFIQVFEWDETIGSLIISNVRADDPTMSYTPVGDVRSCEGQDTPQFDVSVTPLCYDVEGTVYPGWQAWVFSDGMYLTTLYFASDGSALIAPDVVDCPPLALEETLVAVLDQLAVIDGHVDGLEDCCADSNTLLTGIGMDIGDIETLLTTLNSIVATQATLASILLAVDNLEGYTDGIETLLTSLSACCTAQSITLSSILSSVDGLAGFVDGIEALLTSLGACCTAQSVTLTAILAAVDQLEGFTDGIEGNQTTQITNQTTMITRLTEIRDYLDTVETKLQTLIDATHLEDAPHVSGDRGMFVLGVRNDAAVALTDANGDYTPFATDSAGRVGISDLGGSITVDGTVAATVAPSTSGGLSIYKNLDVNATGVNIKASAGQVYTLIITNRANAERFLKLYNKASAPTVGTDTPVMTIPLDGKTGGGQTAIEVDISSGVAFSLGIGIAATTGIADANTGNPSVNDVVVTVGFK